MKGERRGGRKKGTPNKKTADMLAKVEASGKTPLEFFCGVMNDELEDMDRRFQAAQEALPYVHAKRLAVMPDGEGGTKAAGIQVNIYGTDAQL